MRIRPSSIGAPKKKSGRPAPGPGTNPAVGPWKSTEKVGPTGPNAVVHKNAATTRTPTVCRCPQQVITISMPRPETRSCGICPRSSSGPAVSYQRCRQSCSTRRTRYSNGSGPRSRSRPMVPSPVSTSWLNPVSRSSARHGASMSGACGDEPQRQARASVRSQFCSSNKGE